MVEVAAVVVGALVVVEAAVVADAAVVVGAAVVEAVAGLNPRSLTSSPKSNPPSPFAAKSFPSLMTLSRKVSAQSSWVVLKMLRNESNIDWQKHQDSGVEME